MNKTILKYAFVLAIATSFLLYAFEKSSIIKLKNDSILKASITTTPSPDNDKTNEDSSKIKKNKIIDNRKLLVD